MYNILYEVQALYKDLPPGQACPTTRAEARFAFISDKAEFASEDLLDV